MATQTTKNSELRKSLEVKPPSADIDWLNILVYGDPGAGKTYFGGTAEDSPLTSPVLFLDIEGGTATIRKRKGIDVRRIRSMKEIESIYNTLYKSIDNESIYYKTVVIDSLSELADVDMKLIMKNAKNANPDKVDEDVPSPREWGKARNHIRTIVRAFRDLPCNVICTAQLFTLQEENQPTKYSPGFAGKLRVEVPGFMDIVGYMSAKSSGEVITRRMQVQGTNRVVAKDRTATLGTVLENTNVPDMFTLIHS
jgi:phage nucleotide-binding protein